MSERADAIFDELYEEIARHMGVIQFVKGYQLPKLVEQHREKIVEIIDGILERHA